MISRSLVIVMAVLAFCAWVVFLGGVAALQADCIAQGAYHNVLLGVEGCSKWFRFYWFLIAFEFVIIIAAFSALIAGRLAHSRLALLALITAALTLYILAGNALLSGLFGNTFVGSGRRRMQTAAAGAIMTAAFNALLLCVLGTTPEPVGEGHYAGKDGRGTTTVVVDAAAPATVTAGHNV